MSLRTTKGLLFASSLALGIAAVGCGDDDKSPSGDEMDASIDGGAPDAAAPKADATTSGAITCGSETCTPGSLVGVTIAACCVEGTNACGLNSDDIKKVNMASKFTGCIPKDTPQASASTHCGAFLDQVEPDPYPAGDAKNTEAHTNGGLDIPSGTGAGAALVFDGCCLANGECGAYLRTPRTYDPSFLDLHLGCVGITTLQSSLAGDPSATPKVPTLAPYCNPSTGNKECPAKLGLLCDSLKGRGLPITCTAETDTPSWACVLAGLPRNDAPVTVTESCFAGLPFAAQGCGETVTTAPGESQCVPGLPANKFGCGAAPSAGPVVPNVSKLGCGCGVGQGPTATRACIPNAPTDVCGAVDPVAADLAKVPEFLCGCGETVAQTPNGQPSKLCLSYLPTNVCGTKPIDATSPELAVVPEFLCGCENETIPQTNCLRDVDAAVCGTRQTEIDNKGTAGDASDDCLIGVPEYARGCGPAAAPSAGNRTCLRNAEELPGCVDTLVGTRTLGGASVECLVGVPEYVTGCGDGPGGQPLSATDTCLPRAGKPGVATPVAPASRLSGCVDVTTTPRSVPEYLCGCGETNAYTGQADPDGPIPCLNFVASGVCGGISVPNASAALGSLAALPAMFCGCGDPQIRDNPASFLCIPNVARTVCATGTIPIDSTGTSCVTGVKAALNGCGTTATASAFPIACIPNVDTTIAGCVP